MSAQPIRLHSIFHLCVLSLTALSECAALLAWYQLCLRVVFRLTVVG